MTTTEAPRPWLIARSDTFLGVCEGLGEDLGISGNWFRIAFALALFWSPLGAIAAYFAAGALVLLTRLIVRAPRPTAKVVSLPAKAAADCEVEELSLAA